MVVKIGVKELRANLSSWLDRVQEGDEVVVTERGKPIARLVGVDSRSRREQLIAAGTLTPAQRPKRPIDSSRQIDIGPGKSVTDFLIEQRGGPDR